jgi:hypothetical protein
MAIYHDVYWTMMFIYGREDKEDKEGKDGRTEGQENGREGGRDEE